MKKLKLILFYVLSFTWGIILSSIGLIACLGLLITGHKPHLFHGRVYFEVGSNWGGMELGCFFICGKNPSLHIKQHECGHGIQNIIFGPLTPFLISIPSAIRYWYREIIYRKDKMKYYSLPSYDSIWFEGQATKIGEKLFPRELK